MLSMITVSMALLRSSGLIGSLTLNDANSLAPQRGNGYTPLSCASVDQEIGRMSKGPYDPMDMKALLCFETMAKHGSLARASIELGIADAAVSQRI